jgi:hypothetical protein
MKHYQPERFEALVWLEGRRLLMAVYGGSPYAQIAWAEQLHALAMEIMVEEAHGL